MRPKNLLGRRFGKLKVINHLGLGLSGREEWLCLCDCGNSKIVHSGLLLRDKTKSCGCLLYKHSDYYTRFYRIYKALRHRGTNQDHDKYADITICDSWLGYISFKKDMYEKYLEHCNLHGERNTTIDRIDNSGGYSKNNCRWATYSIQNRNKGRKSHEESRYTPEAS